MTTERCRNAQSRTLEKQGNYNTTPLWKGHTTHVVHSLTRKRHLLRTHRLNLHGLELNLRLYRHQGVCLMISLWRSAARRRANLSHSLLL
ncbi:hypothetical protein PsYK624_044830 [Phanerochaete sordida]|uniref:Uncharacterized protein n=1 Tax=Phanerochaete sordida TaxID=48140 RepID=A0A9P3G5V9_9APHY|nr:hypothetical protein PsYK624_044830 [Phanerochaete sordida]